MVDQCECNMLNHPIAPVHRIERQCTNRQSNQSQEEEHYWNSERNHRAGYPSHPHRDNDPYSEDEDQEEDEYLRNDRYNPRGGRRYDNCRPTNNRGGKPSHGPR